jgi:hypothetical protein
MWVLRLKKDTGNCALALAQVFGLIPTSLRITGQIRPMLMMAPESSIPAAVCARPVPKSRRFSAYTSPTKALWPPCLFAEQCWRDYVHSFVALQQLALLWHFGLGEFCEKHFTVRAS